jgi:mono/diheme cytochrome c family protein
MRKTLLIGVALTLCVTIAHPQTRPPAPGAAASASTSTTQRVLLDQYCVTCHNDKLKTANLSLEKLDLTTAGDHAELWEKVIRKLRAGVMPPPGIRRPPVAEYEGLRDWLEAAMDRKAASAPNPGSVVLHRLNRTEYANVIRDLLEIEIDPAAYLPSDDSARGFDNVAGSLTISPTLLEAYTTAATRIARMAVGYWKSPTAANYIAPGDTSQNQHVDGLPLNTRGGLLVTHNFPADGEYKFEIQNFGLGKYTPGEKIEFLVDGERVELFDYVGVGLSQGMQADNDGSIAITVPVKAGSRKVGVTFLATNYRPTLDLIKQYERKSLENNSIPQLQYYPAIGLLRIQGPFGASRPEDSPSIRKVFTCRPNTASQEEACAKQIVTTLTRRAFRRPVTPLDLESLMNFYVEGRKDGGTFDDGIELALRRLLIDPQFLVRAEKEPAALANGKTYRITDLELASRLSFFLWSSIPDETLINLAAQNRLSNPTVLEQQVKRMLSDPRSEALVTNFGDQLLYLRNLTATSPDGVFYPHWDDELRNGFKRETQMLFESIMREDRNVTDLLTANYTFVNERLAKHYGIPNVYGGQFRRVPLGPEMDYRRGLLGQGSFLSMTWVQNFRTSPVKRGVWILENILGTPPPEPPPNVPALEDSVAGAGKVLSLREQMTLHRKNEPCASCHKIMDPIGFALENFDADAKWRARHGGDGGVPIDATVELWDGTKVSGPAELRQRLLYYSPQFVRMITEKMMTYGLGRGVEYYDMPVVRSIVRDSAKNNYRFSSLVMGIIKSAPFQTRVKGADSALD